MDNYDNWKSTEIKHETLSGMRCSECGEPILVGETYYEISELFCQHCIDEHTHYADEYIDCEVCGGRIEENEQYTEVYGLRICKKCLGIAGRVAI